ncbi:MAG: tRNA (adenosine(37)-N6)-threonylcarbamoyltransferase complex ATPase subunit type 1 TsaE [Moorellales bacterium]
MADTEVWGLWEITVCNPEDTRRLGETLGRLVQNGQVICLHGGLGAGKTVLAQGIARGLEVSEPVTSPSFTLVHEYQGRLPLYHLDLYRLEPEAVWDLGLAEYLGQGVTVVEWPERLGPFLPPECLWVSIESSPGSENERRLRWEARGEGYRRLLEELKQRCGFWA